MSVFARTKRYRKSDPLKSRPKPASPLGKNVRNWTNDRLESVLLHPLNMGDDGKDYGPIAHLLQDEFNRRVTTRHERQLKQDEKDWQAFENYASGRKEKLRVILQDLKLRGGLTYSLALDLKREIEYLTGLETCPFVWAIYETNNRREEND